MKAFALLAALAVAGCATTPVAPPTTKTPICAVLGKPIVYNSHNKDSDWHAGPKLAPQLAVKNQTGVNLRCQAYR